METNVLVQTLETPTETTGSPSEGTFSFKRPPHPPPQPGLLLSQKSPLTPPFRLGEEAPFRFRFLGARRANRPGLGLPPVDSSPTSARRLPRAAAASLSPPPAASGRRLRRRRAAAALSQPPPPSGCRRRRRAATSYVGSQRTLWSRGLPGAAAMSALLAEPCLHQMCSVI
ncbi:hypothetical protein PVAP13_2KG279332 [Panicum virgatum]|uniref:Uncharacterized protein n=1 Tax=Panicum virgatum TaxID=38727 RepID=A0A8T0W2A5_PANVG|nr:hypothetical protein PVAP13_2KG279332 [Panicum virgatum]